MIAWGHKIWRTPQRLVFTTDQPFRVLASKFLIKPGRDVNRSFDIDFMGGFNHGLEEIEVQSRMHLIGFTGMISPAMMTLCKYSDGIDMTSFQCLLELLFGKLAPDITDFFGSMEV